jgi:HD-GYP domain-containing protein (c-di-GMP phosphodiesterase class II)
MIPSYELSNSWTCGPAPKKKMSESDNNSYRILVVDDDSTILDLYQRILNPTNPQPFLPDFEITSCSQGDDAVDRVRRSTADNAPFALVFLDLNMPPGPDGQWTAKHIHRLDPSINIVVVTGYRTTLSSEVVNRASISDKLLYLHKPFHPQEIIQFATALSAKWKAERQLLALHSDLEALVEKRTAELVQSNKLLKTEIDNGKRMQLELQDSFENLKKVMNATVQAISTTIEKRDPYTSGHQQRVADLSRTIAREIGFSENEIEGIYIAAAIHDIGKISLPAEILSKPVPLSDIEISLIQAHSQTGYDILKGIKFPWPIAEIVLQHHERLDGSGYPRGLAGDDILMAARIIGVADVVETMASHRPYRPSMGIDKALEEVTQNRGVLYESLVVDACLKIFNTEGFQLPS